MTKQHQMWLDDIFSCRVLRYRDEGVGNNVDRGIGEMWNEVGGLKVDENIGDVRR